MRVFYQFTVLLTRSKVEADFKRTVCYVRFFCKLPMARVWYVLAGVTIYLEIFYVSG